MKKKKQSEPTEDAADAALCPAPAISGCEPLLCHVGTKKGPPLHPGSLRGQSLQLLLITPSSVNGLFFVRVWWARVLMIDRRFLLFSFLHLMIFSRMWLCTNFFIQVNTLPFWPRSVQGFDHPRLSHFLENKGTKMQILSLEP